MHCYRYIILGINIDKTFWGLGWVEWVVRAIYTTTEESNWIFKPISFICFPTHMFFSPLTCFFHSYFFPTHMFFSHSYVFQQTCRLLSYSLPSWNLIYAKNSKCLFQHHIKRFDRCPNIDSQATSEGQRPHWNFYFAKWTWDTVSQSVSQSVEHFSIKTFGMCWGDIVMVMRIDEKEGGTGTAKIVVFFSGSDFNSNWYIKKSVCVCVRGGG